MIVALSIIGIFLGHCNILILFILMNKLFYNILGEIKNMSIILLICFIFVFAALT